MTNEDRTDPRVIFPQRLQQLRTRRRISGKTLGELCGLGGGAVRRYERAEVAPKMDSLCALADFFDVSVDYLLGRTDRC